MTLTLRPITLDDVVGFHAALNSVAREMRYLRLTQAPPLESTRSFVASNLGNGNPQYVAIDGKTVVGWCDICRSGDARSEHIGVLGMGLLASYRGRGIGSRLVQATLGAAAPLFRRVELEVYVTNTSAIKLYERSGFQHEGVRRAAIHIDGTDVDVAMMGLLFWSP